jgi:site-specific recombinase XerD
MTMLAPTMQSFFTEYLIGQRGASRHTITAYRDTLRLLLGYIHERTGIYPSNVDIAVVDAVLVSDFLAMLETTRHNSTRTRNARLGAIHSLFSHAALRHPEHADLIARVLAIPFKTCDETIVTYLDNAEIDVLLECPNRSTWTGRRDHLLLLLMITTGMRVSEVTSLTRADTFTDGPGVHIACRGKGRKERITPLDRTTAADLREWIIENSESLSPFMFTACGTTRKMSTDAVSQRIQMYATIAAVTCPTIADKNVTPHTLRHTCAMRMLAAGIDATTIALWLGHESPASTRPYLHADLELKQRALDRIAPPQTPKGRYLPSDKLLTFLKTL